MTDAARASIGHRPQRRPDWRPHLELPRVFTRRQCERIVALGSGLEAEDAGLAGESDDAAVRRSQVRWLGRDERTEWIYRKLADVADRANRTFRFDLTGFTEDLQFTTYGRRGAFYTWHQDGLDGEVAGRKLSLVVQLTPPDDYRGADLEFLDVVEDLAADEREAWRRRARAQGTVVVFPAFEYHRVTRLGRGVRHSLVCWLGGPPFR